MSPGCEPAPDGAAPVAGAGIGLFDGEFAPTQYDLTNAQPFTSGVVHLTYTKR